VFLPPSRTLVTPIPAIYIKYKFIRQIDMAILAGQISSTSNRHMIRVDFLFADQAWSITSISTGQQMQHARLFSLLLFWRSKTRCTSHSTSSSSSHPILYLSPVSPASIPPHSIPSLTNPTTPPKPSCPNKSPSSGRYTPHPCEAPALVPHYCTLFRK